MLRPHFDALVYTRARYEPPTRREGHTGDVMVVCRDLGLCSSAQVEYRYHASIGANHNARRVHSSATEAPSAIIWLVMVHILELDALSLKIGQPQHPNIAAIVHGADKLIAIAAYELEIVD